MMFGASCLALLHVRQVKEKILASMNIERLVLEIDSGMEQARRLHGDFFLQAPHIGFTAAHRQFVQPSIRQAANVIAMSDKLRDILLLSEAPETLQTPQADLNLYLSVAKRFAETSIQAVELVTKRDAPEKGLTVQMSGCINSFEASLAQYPDLLTLHNQARGFFQEYLIHHQRPVMQSAFNVASTLRAAISNDQAIPPEEKQAIVTLLKRCRATAEEIVALDLQVSHAFNDFTLQSATTRMTSKSLLKFAQEESTRAQQEIEFSYKIVFFAMVVVSFFCVVILILLARKVDRDITRKILRMKERARELSKGNLDVRCEEVGEDELRQLAQTFNFMASYIQELVSTLEDKVILRTAQLGESEYRFRHLVANLPLIPVQGYDCERNTIFWNNASEQLYGYAATEVMGRKIEELIIADTMQEGFVQETRDWLDKNITPASSETIRRHKNGSLVPVYSSHVMLTSSKGEKEMYSVDINLVEIKQAQEERDQHVVLYQELFAHTNSGVAVYEAVDGGQDFVFIDVNEAMEQIEETSREELLGRRITKAFPGVVEFGLVDVLRRVWQSGQPEHFPMAFYHDSKIKGWRENYVYKVPSGQLVTVYQDLTKVKQAEEENARIEEQLHRAQKMEAIGLMAGGVAHDLNNILSGIVGYPDLILMQRPGDDKLKALVEPIKESGRRAAAIVADLLTVARGVASVKENKELNTLIREYLSSPEGKKLQTIYPDISYEMHLEARQSAISCSPIHIKKCLMNLVINAAEAIGGFGRIMISTGDLTLDSTMAEKRCLVPGKYVALTISDSGKGIAAEDLAHIFEPFYSKKVMGRSGTGLGLSVVWNAVKDHKGSITVNSNEKGTFFELVFPVVSNNTVTGNDKKNPSAITSGNGGRILVVDDEPQLLDIARQALQLLGYSVETVSSGEEAVAYLQNDTVDLVLLDMLMEPGMNGRETFEGILTIHPRQKAIVVSGFADNDEVKKTIRLGAKGLLAKPYTIQQLSEAVLSVIG